MTDLVILEELAPQILTDVRYAGSENFLGRPVQGYEQAVIRCTEPVARALIRIDADLRSEGLRLLVYDAYRPRCAVDDFAAWAKDVDDTARKAVQYPNVDKADLFRLGYIAYRSSHTGGRAVDLTLCTEDGTPLDMGTCFDFMDEASHPASELVSEEAHANRMKLRRIMLRYGFTGIDSEWWHFSLRKEPVGISACLLGENCKYSGGNNRNEDILRWSQDLTVIPVCPEVEGGLSTPRSPVELRSGCAVNKDGIDVTEEFCRGAARCADALQEAGCTLCVTQARSPSCGCGTIYDGTFSGRLIPGDGLFVQALKARGIRTVSSSDFAALLEQEEL